MVNKFDIIKRMVENNPEDYNAWYLLGIEYRESNFKNEALSAFTEALKYCNDNSKVKIIEELTKLTLGEKTEKDFEGFQECEDLKEEAVLLCNSDGADNVVPFQVIKGSKKEENEDLIRISFEDVGGLEEVKKAIKMKIIKPFENPGLFSMFKKKIGGGILLFGPPGCGKTFIAKATAGECNANFISVHISDILDKFFGESEYRVKEIFAQAKYKKPSILFFDEIDTLGYNRSKLSSEFMRGVIDQFLIEMDGIDSSNDKLLIFGATNTPWDIDAAFKRPGRFDRLIFVPPPDREAREAIFKLKLKDKPLENMDYSILANKTELYSGADIENVVEMAVEKVIEEIMETETERSINMKDLLYAIERTTPSTIDWLRTVKNYVKYSNQSGFYDEVKEYLSKHKII